MSFNARLKALKDFKPSLSLSLYNLKLPKMTLHLFSSIEFVKLQANLLSFSDFLVVRKLILELNFFFNKYQYFLDMMIMANIIMVDITTCIRFYQP